jgi:hypothetical protein
MVRGIYFTGWLHESPPEPAGRNIRAYTASLRATTGGTSRNLD